MKGAVAGSNDVKKLECAVDLTGYDFSTPWCVMTVIEEKRPIVVIECGPEGWKKIKGREPKISCEFKKIPLRCIVQYGAFYLVPDWMENKEQAPI